MKGIVMDGAMCMSIRIVEVKYVFFINTPELDAEFSM
jgi:hypothetical protein